MYARNPVDEAEQAAINAPPVTSSNVMGLRLVGVAKRLRLRGREVAALLGGELEEPPTEVTSINGHRSILQ
jgi:hypothetical protein